MPITKNNRRLPAYLLLALIATLAVPALSHASGHCKFKELSPWTKQWYPMCKTPATAASCDEWAMTEGISEAKFGDGDCPAAGMVGACAVDGVSQYFYQTSTAAAAMGCSQVNGQWTPRPE